ncbi:zinc protease PQQL-like isoform X1 [Chenopodium quinoa]|uniref:zinc protease PQQL-like isoform X1 n=2 Tax=Chenopodium quinoa TaxID=63459 RepID=UPI000B77DAB6|nr:zinc protease PQQL-like isoform X1 [Chenopodium quinoa]XP_021725007.1 zinc protease PQQL-like isoform X1 [Chenopodium quinoa]
MDAHLPKETKELAKKHRFKSLKRVDLVPDQLLDPTPFGAQYGSLENGLTYYVRCNPKPQMRAALALAVKVGSIFEEENERGIAHIVEHLAFSATKKYTNHDIVKFLESIGAEFGACGNAYTSFDETVYELFVPIDKPGILSEAISILSEFSSEIRISEEDLDKERGAVLEEYRQGRDASGRLSEETFASIMKGSKYANRLPIGLEKVIRSAPAKIPKQFYEKWYNLQSMAVIAVGDFPNTESVVELIAQKFGHIISPEPPIISPGPKIPFHGETRFSCLVEPEASGTTVEINWKMLNDEPKTVRDYKDWLIGVVFRSALNRRFTKISRRKNPPFFVCSAAEVELVRPVKAIQISSSCKEKSILEALTSVLTELARVRSHDFSEREISIACANIMAEMESAYLEREKMQSSTWRYQYLQHFLRDEAVLGLEFEAQLFKSILPQLSASEVSRYSEKLRMSESSVIIITEPRATVTEKDLKDLLSETNSLEEKGKISPWEDDIIPEEVVQVKPNPGKVSEESEYQDIGVTELVLSNGMKVCYKCTEFKNDQVIFKGYSYGGYSELSESDFLSCILSSSITGEIGQFGYKPTVLEDMLAGKRAGVYTELGAYTRSFIGDCSPSDLETALQLVYQLFVTCVEPDEDDIKRVIHIVEELIRADERDPYSVFTNRVTRIKYGNSYFYKSPLVNDLPKVDPKKACEYFDCSFKDPSTFTVVIIGNLDPAMIQPLILEYLGGIPKPSEPVFHLKLDDLKGLPSTPPVNVVREIVRSPMVEAQCSVHISLNIKLCSETLLEEMWFATFLSQLLQTKMTQALRFKHGEIYSVSVDSNFGYSKPSKTADLEGEITIEFSCDPIVSSALVDIALDETLHLQEHGPSEEDVSTVLEIEQRDHENELQENIFWLFQILKSYRSRLYTDNLESTFQLLDKARSRARQTLSPLTAKWALQKILPYPCKQHYVSVTLIPETNRFRLLKHQLKTQLKQKYYGRYMKTVDKVWKVFARKHVSH